MQTLSCLFDGLTYSAEGIAESDIQGEMLSVAEFKVMLASDPAFRDEICSAVARRFGDYEKLVEEVALTGFDARLARTLLRLQNDAGEVHATHENLAAETASGRAFVTRRLAEFSGNGLVELQRGSIVLLDIAGLEHIAEDL